VNAVLHGHISRNLRRRQIGAVRIESVCESAQCPGSDALHVGFVDVILRDPVEDLVEDTKLSPLVALGGCAAVPGESASDGIEGDTRGEHDDSDSYLSRHK
jgi:hypothetical protein